jgi:imidazoleglycerol-phosphate dehydratase
MRTGQYSRKTKETEITVEITLEGTGSCEISTGIPFFDHMLQSFGKHAGFDLTVRACGDLDVGPHHTIEDTGIAIGTALNMARGEGKGIRRFGHALIPMDESLATVAVDFGGRPYLVFEATFPYPLEGGIPGSLVGHFFESLCNNARITAHMNVTGTCDHHRCEALFKAFGRAVAESLTLTGNDSVPSTKGTL